MRTSAGLAGSVVVILVADRVTHIGIVAAMLGIAPVLPVARALRLA